MISEKVIRWVTRIVAPEMARNMERGKSAHFTKFTEEDIENFVEVEDRGSDVTIFTFAGLAALFAGLPSFEFKRLLQASGDDYNLVFFRDIRRICYHLTPEGRPQGLQFYEGHVKRLMAELGSSYNVGVGVSAGGSAALYFGTISGFDQAIAFSPGYPLTVYCSPWHQVQTFCDLKRLVTAPAAYTELLYVTLGAAWSYNRLLKTVGKERIWRVLDTLREAPTRPRVTVFYGRGSRPDARQARLFEGLDDVKRVALPTVYHNCAGYLKDRGELGSTILEEVRLGIEARDAAKNGRA